MDVNPCDIVRFEVVPSSPPATFFAPSGRDTAQEFRRKIILIEGAQLLRESLNAVPCMVMLLNANRQIVAANDAFLAVLESAIEDVAQKRPGEALGCIHVNEGPDGCGTARHCATCGAVQAILASQQQEQRVVRECRISIRSSQGTSPLDLRVTASQFFVDQERFILVAAEDISQSKRLRALQRTFFHDVLNTAGCIQGYSQYLDKDTTSDPETCTRLARLSDQLIEAIQAQRDLVCAESGELKTKPEIFPVPELLEEVRAQYTRHPIADGRAIQVADSWGGSITADRHLLLRVLGNMVKNALEATRARLTVTLGCKRQGDHVVFWVHNPGVMSEEVQLQIFQRSFTTKPESGRGLGTYSMKLFGERYLGGHVTFTSTTPEGTTFRLTLPRVPGPDRPGMTPDATDAGHNPTGAAAAELDSAAQKSRGWTRYQPDVSQVWIILKDSPRLAVVVDESFGGIGLALDIADAGDLQPGDELTVLHYGHPTQGSLQWLTIQPESEQVRLGIRWI